MWCCFTTMTRQMLDILHGWKLPLPINIQTYFDIRLLEFDFRCAANLLLLNGLKMLSEYYKSHYIK